MIKSAPELFENILCRLISASDTESLSGDFGEMYTRISGESGKLKAVSWYLLHLLKFTVYYLIQNLYRSLTMFNNYLKIAIRNLIRQKGYSLINIGGLSIGIACSLLLFIWVYDEVSYDSFHDNGDSICRIVTERTTNETYTTPNTPGAFAPFVKENYPEVRDYARLFFTRYVVKYGDENNNVYLDSGLFAEKSFFSIFTFPLIKGELETALAEPNSIVISEKMSRVCFGDNDPMGQTLVLNNKQLCVVTGIFKDVPENSHINFNYVVPIEMVEENGFDLENWTYFAFKTYFLLKPEVDHRVFNDKIYDVYKGNSSSGNPRPVVQPLEEIHLYHSDSGLIKYLYIFSVTGFIVLCIACINFMNLRTARSGKRSVEVGLRKVLGANRSSIIRQFYCESILLSVISLIIALIITVVLMPAFNEISGKNLNAGMLMNTEILSVLTIIAVFTGIAAGSYPALFLSAYQPISVMKGVTKRGRLRAAYFRRILVVTQFSLSVILIIGSIVIAKQLEFIKNKDMGFDKENLLLMRMGTNQYESVKNDLLKDPAIINVTKTNAPLLWLGFETSGVTWEGKGSEDIMTIQLRTVDYDYLKTFGMKMKEGRFFQREFVSDSAQGFIVNEAAAEVMGIENPVGTSFALDGSKRGTIIGVVKDFHHHSMRDKIEPLVLYMHNSWYSNMFVRVAPGRTQDAMALLRKEWSRIDPGYPFQVNFFDERVERMYMDEQKAGRVLNYFTVVAMFIAALGLYGLASYMAEQRTKEIGIRKTLGAKVSSIMGDLLKEFIKWVVISNAIAWPLAYIAAKKWLQNFAYKTSVGPEIFLFAGTIVLATALLTVAYQTIKAALANPVKSLRYE